MDALALLAICDRFGCTPSQAMKEGADVLRLLAIERAVRGGEYGQ